MKKLFATVMMLATLITLSTTPVTKANSKSKLKAYRDKAKRIEINNGFDAIDSADCVDEYWNHKGTVFVERLIGKVIDDNGNGKVLNTAEITEYDYINYSTCKANKGDIIVTYCLYNPESNGEDDIIARWDYIIVHKAK